MGQKPLEKEHSSVLTLPLVVGIVVVVGAIAALAISGVLVYQARAAKTDAERLRAMLAAQQERVAAEERAEKDAAAAEHPQPTAFAPPGAEAPPTSSPTTTDQPSGLKPGIRLQAQRPVHWDTAEVVDILEDSKVKVRWLSGEPGEDVIASELVRGEEPPTN